MWPRLSLLFLSLIILVKRGAGNIYSPPSCALRCWENSKFVSVCLGDNACLCNEASYQNAVFQCLYAQCDTAHFGTALHYAISRCSETSIELHQRGTLHTITRNELRRREENYVAGLDKLFGSNSAGGFQTQSSGGLLTQDGDMFPTGSIDIYFVPSTISAELTPSSIEITMSKTPPTASSVSLRATSVYPGSAATHTPQLFTGTGLKIDPYIIRVILIPVITLYLVL